MSNRTALNGAETDIPTFPVSVLSKNANGIFRRFGPEMPFINSETGVFRADDVVGLCNEAKTRQVASLPVILNG